MQKKASALMKLHNSTNSGMHKILEDGNVKAGKKSW